MGLSCYEQRITGAEESISFNALTGLSCYICAPDFSFYDSMPFQCPHGLELLPDRYAIQGLSELFQCPLGLELLPHVDSSTNFINVFQCPLGLIPHFYHKESYYSWQRRQQRFNALSGLYLISTWHSLIIQTIIQVGFNALSGLYLISTQMQKL